MSVISRNSMLGSQRAVGRYVRRDLFSNTQIAENKSLNSPMSILKFQKNESDKIKHICLYVSIYFITNLYRKIYVRKFIMILMILFIIMVVTLDGYPHNVFTVNILFHNICILDIF